MELKIEKEKLIEIASIIVISIILFTNLVIENGKYLVYIYIAIACTLAYVMFLIFKKPNIIKELFKSYHLIWITLFAIEMFIYGFFGKETEQYSLKFHMLNLVWIFMVLIILQNHKGKTKDIMAKTASIVITAMSTYILFNDFSMFIKIFTNGEIGRIGATASGNVNATAISYVFLLIPILYKIGIDKSNKYIPFAILGIVFMLLTGSKKGIIGLVIILCIIIISKAKNNKELVKTILKIGIMISIIAILSYCIPVLHNLLGERIENMVSSIMNFNENDQSSTGLRLNFILTAFTKAWDKPILGHGWSSFAPMYGYSSLYQTNMYTHNNYAEILFSFGLLGLFLYYWFPIKMIVKTSKNANKGRKTLGWLYIVNMLFIDFAAVTCYSSILGFLAFSIVNLVLKESEDKEVLESSTKEINKQEETQVELK